MSDDQACHFRFGKVFRGDKVKHCEQRGGVGAILYSDPADVAAEGTSPDKVYPNTAYLPGSGMQRGSTLYDKGDPLSPGYPSVEGAYRHTPDQVKSRLPQIPSQPIGYDDAKIILEKLAGKPVPESWQGGIEGITYKIGNEANPDFDGWKLQLKTNNIFDTKKDANVIGYIKGSVEPDRYVMMGNHRDAWGYGSARPVLRNCNNDGGGPRPGKAHGERLEAQEDHNLCLMGC